MVWVEGVPRRTIGTVTVRPQRCGNVPRRTIGTVTVRPRVWKGVLRRTIGAIIAGSWQGSGGSQQQQNTIIKYLGIASGLFGVSWAKPNFQYFQCWWACGARDLNTSASRMVGRQALEVAGHDMAVDGCGKTKGRETGEPQKGLS